MSEIDPTPPPLGTADPPAATRAVVQRFLAALAAGDLDGVAALFAPDIDWRLSWPDEWLAGPIPWIRHRRTEDARAHFATLAEQNTPHGEGTTVEHVVADGTDAVILGTIRNLMRRSGTPYRARFALRLTVEHGRISRYHIYEDSLTVAAAWAGPSGAPPPVPHANGRSGSPPNRR